MILGVRNRIVSLICKIKMKKNKVIFEKDIKIRGMIVVVRNAIGQRKNNNSQIEIGKNVTVNSGKKYNIIGGDTKTIIRTINDGKIFIGNNVGISNSAIVSLKSITIEDNVLIGGGVKIYDNDFHPLEYNARKQNDFGKIKAAAITIKEGAFIGAGTYILKGVTIGERAIIGAGSVVTKNIPPDEIWAGNPAIYIRKNI